MNTLRLFVFAIPALTVLACTTSHRDCENPDHVTTDIIHASDGTVTSARRVSWSDGSTCFDGPFVRADKHGSVILSGLYYCNTRHGSWFERLEPFDVFVELWMGEVIGPLRIAYSVGKETRQLNYLLRGGAHGEVADFGHVPVEWAKRMLNAGDKVVVDNGRSRGSTVVPLLGVIWFSPELADGIGRAVLLRTDTMEELAYWHSIE